MATRRMTFVILSKMDDCDCCPSKDNPNHVHVVGIRSTELAARKLADEWEGWFEAMILNDGLQLKPRGIRKKTKK